MAIHRQMVVLDVPFDPEQGEAPPTQWNWNELLDSAQEIDVMGHGPIYKSERPEDRDG